MIRLMCGVMRQTRVLHSSGLVDISDVLKRNQLRMLGNVTRRRNDESLGKIKADILRHLSGVQQVPQKRHGKGLWRRN